MLSTRSPLWLLFVLTLTNCGWAAPDAGTEAVLIEKPWFLGHGGVSPEPVRTGRTLIAFTTDVEYVDMRPLQFSLHLNDFMSQDGVPLDFDAIIRLKVTDSVKLIKNFGPNWYESNIEAELSNRVRQAVRKHGIGTSKNFQFLGRPFLALLVRGAKRPERRVRGSDWLSA